MKENIDDEVLQLAVKLYFDLPFYKRWKIYSYYNSNNWDVTYEWKKCCHVALTMICDMNDWSKNAIKQIKEDLKP